MYSHRVKSVGLITFFVILGFLFPRCSHSVAGAYIHHTRPSTDNQEIVLNDDGTFKYTVIFDAFGSFTFDGTWKKKRGRLHLEEFPKDAVSESRGFLMESSQNISEKRITVLDVKDSTAVPGAEILVNNLNSLLQTDVNGTTTLPAVPIDSINVKFISQSTFYIRNPHANYFIAYILIKEREPWLKSAPTKQWIIKGRKLIGLDSVGRREKDNSLTKVFQSIKHHCKN